MSFSDEKWIKNFLDTSEEAVGGVLEKVFLKIAFPKFAKWSL